MLATPHDRIPDISRLASLLADPGRALMLLLLQDGRLYPASDLAQAAGLSPQAASNHLAKLLHGQAVRVEQRGRHRYYGLASPAIAHALEALSAAAGESRSAVRPKGNADIRLARSCYDHLAGRLGITVADFLQQQQLLQRLEEREFAVTPAGADWLAARLDIQLAGIARPRRPLARACLDWSERRDHIAGSLGAALCQAFLQRGLTERRSDSRALRITPAGYAFLKQECGVGSEQLRGD
ncbi:helix-turn-helix domain-containing protein [Chromobacterium alkanivorans]|uniref:ArsR/SmtB family transcription factor n=1 Tax=Chromobacterium alkanivorans TaxID=1071719 RepID=UPI0019675D4F|nr:helix-turn-helix transcriptional regulator [Chromobacterium alkanivorans]MBN3006281.1 helix-turn-helix domain-containing protein [Chromobacterium alkanivorans]